MTEHLSKEAFAKLGAPDLVYVRAISARDALAGADLDDGAEIDPDAILYAVHAADGSRLALLDNRQAAFAVARGNELKPVSVH